MKQVKCLLGGEKITNRLTWTGSESCALVVVWITNKVVLLGFLWPITLLCLALSPHLVFLRVLPLVRWIPAVRPMGRLTSPTMGVALLPFYASVVGTVSLTWRMRNMWSGQGPAFSLNYPAILVLEFWPSGNESPIALPWGDPCTSCLSPMAKTPRSKCSRPTFKPCHS